MSLHTLGCRTKPWEVAWRDPSFSTVFFHQNVVTRQVTTSAADTFRNDGALVNVLTGLGIAGKDKSLGTTVATQSLLGQTDLEQLYNHGIPRRYVDAIADEILRHPVSIKLGSEQRDADKDTIAKFEEYLKNTHFHFALSEVIKLQRLYGGAALVLLIDDGLPPEEPVDLKRIRALRGYIPLSRWELIPEDFNITDWSKPSYYRLTTSQKITSDQVSPYVNVKIHHTRVARFDGLYLPWRVRARNTGWGAPVLQLIWEAYKRYESAMSGLETMTSDADTFVHKIPGLFQRIASGNEADLRKRLEANNLSRSVYGGMVVDVEEDVNFLNRNLTNIASATQPFVTDLQAATGWPASILLGESPGGLGKEGRFEERVWSSIVEQWEENYCRTPITDIFTYILASREGPTRGRPPESWTVDFPSVYTKTDEEKVALQLQMANVDSTYINLQVLNALEVRQSRFGRTEFSIDTTLNEAVTDQMISQADAQFNTQMLNYEAQAQAALGGAGTADPNAAPPEDAGDPQEASLPDPNAEPPQPDTKAKRKDAFDSYEAHGIRIRVAHTAGNARAGYLITPDGQRTDSSAQAPLMVLGPHRGRAYCLYRARFVLDDELIDGPYVTGFASMRAARQGVAALFPRQNVAGLSPIPEGEFAALRAGWEVY